MGARPSSFKRGGGRLNGVDGVIVGYRYTDEFFGTPYTAGKIRDLKGKMIDKPHNLNIALSVRVDGADEDTVETLKVAADFDSWLVSEDEQNVTPVDENGETVEREFSAKSKWGKFVSSLIRPTDGEDGFPEERLPEDPTDFSYTAIVGTRVRFAQAGLTQEELANIRKLGATEKRKGKDGKEYDRTDLVVEHVYSLPDEQPVKAAGKTNGKIAGKAGAPAAAPTKSKAKTSKPDVSERAIEVLKAILADNKGEIKKPKLSLATLKKMTSPADREIREDVRTWLFDDNNLEGIEGVVYDRESGDIATA